MVRKHYEKIMTKRNKRVEKVIELIEQQELEDQSKGPYYMNTDGTIDWARLAKHISEATRGR